MAPGAERTDVELLIAAHSHYPSESSGSHYDEVLTEVQRRATEFGCLGKADIGALMLWKRLNLASRWTNTLNELPDAHVRAVTRRAIEYARRTDLSIPDAAGSARTALLELPGCTSGHPVPSTILTAGAPERMAVYDRRALAALDVLHIVRPRVYSRYMAVVCELIALVETDAGLIWLPRDVDKALFVLGGVTGESGLRALQ